MAEDLALKQRFDKMVSDRANWDNVWQDIADHCLPVSSDFNTEHADGQRRNSRLFTEDPQDALEKFSSAIEGMLTPRMQKWHNLRAPDPEANKNEEIIKFLDGINNSLFFYRYNSGSSFSSAMYEAYTSLGAFGTAVMFIDRLPDGGPHYRTLHMKDVFIKENHFDVVDTVFRRIVMSARNAADKYSRDGDRLPEQIMQKAKESPDTDVTIIHAVYPMGENDKGREKGWNFHSVHFDYDTGQVLRRGGYNSNPYVVARWFKAPRETYGRGPGHKALSAMKRLNKIWKDAIAVSHQKAVPTLLAHNKAIFNKNSLKPSGIINRGVSADGRQLVIPMQTGGDLGAMEWIINQTVSKIRSIFLVDLFQVLTEGPRMTATEVLTRVQEKGTLLAPILGRIQTELLEPMVSREIDILVEDGQIPISEAPEELITEDGRVQEYTLSFDSPMTQSMKSGEIIGIQRVLDFALPLANVTPRALQVIDIDKALKHVALNSGMPMDLLRTDAQLEQLEEEAQAAQADQMAKEDALVSSEVTGNLASAAEKQASAEIKTQGG